MYIGFDIGGFEFFDAKPSKSEESFFFLGYRISTAMIFHEKKIDILFYHRTSLFVRRDEAIVNLGHKFYYLQISRMQASLFRYLTDGSIFGCFRVFHMTFRYDEFSFFLGIFPFKKEYFDLAFLFPINDSTGAFLENSIHALENYKWIKSWVL